MEFDLKSRFEGCSQPCTLANSGEDEVRVQSQGEQRPVVGADGPPPEAAAPEGLARSPGRPAAHERACRRSRSSRLDLDAKGAALAQEELYPRGLAAPERTGGETPQNVFGGESEGEGQGAASRERSSAMPASSPKASSLRGYVTGAGVSVRGVKCTGAGESGAQSAHLPKLAAAALSRSVAWIIEPARGTVRTGLGVGPCKRRGGWGCSLLTRM